MPSVSYNGQAFQVGSRSIWIVGASMQYARIPPELWRQRIAAAREAGFNTIETACPWTLHEPRRGRYVFDGPCDVKQFVTLCGEAGLRVILRLGPFVGARFDGGGLPAWLADDTSLRLRESDQVFLQRVSGYFRKLIAQIADLEEPKGGPIVLVQSEHAWLCANDAQSDGYLREVTRIIRENGLTVPIINSNDLWQESLGTIDTWRGWDDLLAHLRQMRTLQSDAPRLVSTFAVADADIWGDAHDDARTPDVALTRLAQILAAGAQPIVSPFHGGTNFGFLAGRISGRPDGFVTTSGSLAAPLGEAGARGKKYLALRRLTTFANHFGSVFAELEPDYHPVVLDPIQSTAPARSNGKSNAAGAGVTVLGLRGSLGRIVFVFAPGRKGSGPIPLLLDDGRRMPINLGDQPVGWFTIDVDLSGSGRLDYTNLCPFAIVNRSILILFGPAKTPAFLSINGTPLEASVPGGRKPLVVVHKNVTVVICNQEQIDVTYDDGQQVFVGVSGFDADGAPIAAAGYPKAYVIAREGEVTMRDVTAGRAKTGASRAVGLKNWSAAPATAYADGASPRFASLDGPATLAECGASSGYGWYRVEINSPSARARRCVALHAADRAHLYFDGKLTRIIGDGPGADHGVFELKLPKGAHYAVVLIDAMGRFADGNEMADRKGMFGHIYEIKTLTATKPKSVEASPVHPFDLRGYIAGRAFGQLSDNRQVLWTFTHAKKSPILIDIDGAAASGTLVLNDTPIAYYSGANGACVDRILLDRETCAPFKRGKNILRFAPDMGQPGAVPEITRSTRLYECVNKVTGSDSWFFARWEKPSTSVYAPVAKGGGRAYRGAPCWWRTTVTIQPGSAPAWLDTAGLSKGQVYVNDHDLGRYFTGTTTGKKVGPQTWLYIPEPWLAHDADNEIVIFDEHGFDPSRTRIVRSDHARL